MRHTISLVAIGLALLGAAAGYAFARATQPPPRLPVNAKFHEPPVRAYADVGILGAPVARGNRIQADRSATIHLGRQACNRTEGVTIYRYYVETYRVAGGCDGPGDECDDPEFERLSRVEYDPFAVQPGEFLNDSMPLRLADLPADANALRPGIEEAYELDGELGWHSVRSTMFYLPQP